jgi:hypothetical protein
VNVGASFPPFLLFKGFPSRSKNLVLEIYHHTPFFSFNSWPKKKNWFRLLYLGTTQGTTPLCPRPDVDVSKAMVMANTLVCPSPRELIRLPHPSHSKKTREKENVHWSFERYRLGNKGQKLAKTSRTSCWICGGGGGGGGGARGTMKEKKKRNFFDRPKKIKDHKAKESVQG